jgi:Mg-chelatase subunit ChlD
MADAEVAVQAKGIPLHTAYPKQDGPQRVPVLFEIDVPQLAAQDRPAFELCIVLDRSGSMAGAKMRAALAAVRNAIDALWEGDVLHLVAYSDTSDTIFAGGTMHRTQELHRAAANITAGGQTNISDALLRAQDILTNSGEGPSSKRIFLLSDGQPSSGIQEVSGLGDLAQDIREGGMVISAFGIGGDINEDLMRAIANNGRGSYFFLRETIIRQTMEGAMSTLSRTIGFEAVIGVRSLPPAGQLVRIHRPLADSDASARHDTDGQQAAESVSLGTGNVWIGDLTSGSQKQSLIEASLTVPEDVGAGDLEMLSYELSYRCSSSHEIKRVTGVVSANIDLTTGLGERVPRVLVADEMQQLEPRMREFRELVQDGRRREALTLQSEIIQRLEAIQASDDQGFVSANLRRIRRVAERLEGGVISNAQAVLMVGEALERQAEGDIQHTSSFASVMATPEASYRADHEDNTLLGPTTAPRMGSFGFPSTHTRSEARRPGGRTRRFFRTCFPCFTDRSYPSSSPRAYSEHLNSDVSVDSLPASPPLRAPLHLLSPGFDVSSLPSEFLCPITHEPMTDPVVAQDGHTYERAAIVRWFSEGGLTSPKTGAQISSHSLLPNHALRAQIMTENDRRMLRA